VNKQNEQDVRYSQRSRTKEQNMNRVIILLMLLVLASSLLGGCRNGKAMRRARLPVTSK
jgi:hypothetical protein